MNIRTTPSINETFLEILINCKEQKINAAMLLDVKGMIRAEGLIRAIYLNVNSCHVDPPFLHVDPPSVFVAGFRS